MVQMLLQTPGIPVDGFSAERGLCAATDLSITPVTLPRGVVDFGTQCPIPGRTPDCHHHQHVGAGRTTSRPAPAVGPSCGADARPIGLVPESARSTPTHHTVSLRWRLKPSADPEERHPDPATLHTIHPCKSWWSACGWRWASSLPFFAALGQKSLPLRTARPVRSRVFRWYGQLRDIESRFEASPGSAADLLAELAEIESKVEEASSPAVLRRRAVTRCATASASCANDWLQRRVHAVLHGLLGYGIQRAVDHGLRRKSRAS